MRTKHQYRGFSIEREAYDLFAVRLYQTNPTITHDFKPWCESLEEARQVVDKLIARADRGDGSLQKLP